MTNTWYKKPKYKECSYCNNKFREAALKKIYQYESIEVWVCKKCREETEDIRITRR
jgi:protein-arginine kinase activator protein McsA